MEYQGGWSLDIRSFFTIFPLVLLLTSGCVTIEDDEPNPFSIDDPVEIYDLDGMRFYVEHDLEEDILSMFDTGVWYTEITRSIERISIFDNPEVIHQFFPHGMEVSNQTDGDQVIMDPSERRRMEYDRDGAIIYRCGYIENEVEILQTEEDYISKAIDMIEFIRGSSMEFKIWEIKGPNKVEMNDRSGTSHDLDRMDLSFRQEKDGINVGGTRGWISISVLSNGELYDLLDKSVEIIGTRKNGDRLPDMATTLRELKVEIETWEHKVPKTVHISSCGPAYFAFLDDDEVLETRWEFELLFPDVRDNGWYHVPGESLIDPT